MGTDVTRGERRTARKPKPSEITDDAIRDLFARAAAANRPEAHPTPPEITDDALQGMLSDAGAPVEETPPDALSALATDTPPVLQETQCPSCFGTGTSVCLSCFGLGYHTTSYTTTDWGGTVEYVTEEYPCGCSGGSMACGTCGGRGAVFR